MFPGSSNRFFQPRNRQRIFGTNINDTFIGPDGVTTDDDAFQNSVWVAFDRTTVHKRTRVAFVSVTDNVFLIGLLIGGKLPFQAGWKTCTTPTAKAGFFHFINHISRLHFGQHFCHCFITANRQVVVDIFRIDNPAVAKCNPHLLAEEIHIPKNPEETVIQMIFTNHHIRNRLAFDQVELDDLGHIFDLYVAIHRKAGIDNQDRPFLAHAQTAAQMNADLISQTLFR